MKLLFALTASLFLISCQKEDCKCPVIPTVTTIEPTDLTGVSALSGGNISNNGNSSITERGVVWNTSPNPSIALSTRTSDGVGTGTYSSSISGLSPNTKYYLRAYASNAVGTGYGNEITFNTNDIDLKNGLVAFYPFSGNSGDSSGNNNHGTNFGASLVADRNGNANSAYSFDGISNYIQIPDAPSFNFSTTKQISVAFWVKLEATKGYAGIITKWGPLGKEDDDFQISFNAGATKIGLNVNSSTNTAIPNSILETTDFGLNSWAHFVMECDATGGTMKLYKNGALIASGPAQNSIVKTNTPIHIGRSNSLPNNFFTKMSIDNIRIYNRVLKASEITYLATK